MKNETKRPGEENKVDEETQTEDEEKEKSLLDKTNEASDRVEKATREAKKEADRLERLKSDEILSGKSEAGTPEPKKKEMTDEEYANKALSGDLNG